MMYDGVIEKPELNEETLAHYGIKGMKWKNHKAKILENAYEEKKQRGEETKERLNALFKKKKETTLDILNQQKTKSLRKLTSGKGSSSSSKSKETDNNDKEAEKKSKEIGSNNGLTDEQKKAKYEAYAKKRDAYIKKKKNLRDEYITKKKAYMSRYKRKG